jgi:hypothetical protein
MLTVFTTAPAYAQASCVDNIKKDQQVILRGEIVQSATTEYNDDDGPPHKYMAFISDDPICGYNDKKMTSIEASPVPIKWLGHYVIVIGVVENGENLTFKVEHITDVKQ